MTKDKRKEAIRWTALLLLMAGGGAMAAPPALYRNPAYESPQRADPDDLLLLAGYGLAPDDVVIYRAVEEGTPVPAVPAEVPSRPTADAGYAVTVSSAGVPYSLTIKLPMNLRAAQPYALWVRTAHGEWSRPLTINDARPLWFTPAYLYASARLASLPRELKIVGRNLAPLPGRTVRLRLSGPQRFTGDAVLDDRSSEILEQHVARLRMPDLLRPGRYRVEFTRDGAPWLEVPGQWLEVLSDPPQSKDFSVSDSRYGGCRPDDGADDTACILRAIAAAKSEGGGSVYFEPGTWDLIDSGQAGLIGDEGIVVPTGVNLKGAGTATTRLARHPEWSARAPAAAALTLLGHNEVTGITFSDLKEYQARDRAGPFLKIGEQFERAASHSDASSATPAVDGVVITGNVFDKTMVAIGNGGLPISHLFVTHNTFGAFSSALELAGNRFNMINKYRIDDSVISYNLFKPGSKLDPIEKTGALASELGAGDRVDFSGNTADGAATDYLYSPDDARGWRAAFFWNMDNDIEKVLVSQNTATCTGDKIGDGEAFAFDTNANTFAFKHAEAVVRATTSSVDVAAPLAARQNDRDVPIASYYIGHWMQVVAGPGIGQTRKITGYTTDPTSHVTTIRVAPDWDVVPAPEQTLIAVGREFWQLYVLDNTIDNRKPLCLKSNRSRHDAGVIVMWAQSADSVIAGNRQYDSDGIFAQQAYLLPEHPCPDCTMQSLFQSFLDIRANLVDGEYDWTTDCSASGITVGAGAAPWSEAAPPTLGFGVSISHNVIRHADALHSGAISQLDSWYAGPPPHRWPLSDNLIIQHNSISDIEGGRALPICGKGYPRIAIAFPDYEIAWRTVLYANSCKSVSTPLGAGGVDSVKVCPSSAPDSCECQTR
ncbi:MAG: hypothetical protein ABSG30_15410 [Steroidobacteraceae bacterium]